MSLTRDLKLKKVLDLTRALEERKALYAELDRLILELQSEGFVKAEIDGLVLELKDNFAAGNVGFTTAAVKRFEIEVITKELAEKREKRKAK